MLQWLFLVILQKCLSDFASDLQLKTNLIAFHQLHLLYPITSTSMRENYNERLGKIILTEIYHFHTEILGCFFKFQLFL